MAADREALELVHTQLTEFWAQRLKDAKELLDDGVTLKAPLTAAEATAIAKFLKDNNITALISSSPAGKNVLDDLPFEYEEVQP